MLFYIIGYIVEIKNVKKELKDYIQFIIFLWRIFNKEYRR